MYFNECIYGACDAYSAPTHDGCIRISSINFLRRNENGVACLLLLFVEIRIAMPFQSYDEQDKQSLEHTTLPIVTGHKLNN